MTDSDTDRSSGIDSARDPYSSATAAQTIECQVAVIGAGMAGLCAALFASERGLSTVHVGGCGQVAYAAGPWDLLAVHPLSEQKIWTDPWSGIEALTNDLPNHPYSHLTQAQIRAAFAELLSVFEQADYPYRGETELNCELLTPVGTLKPTYCVPHTMWDGILAWRRKSSTLLVDFHGLKDFSARQITANLQDRWPGLRAKRIPFPESTQKGELCMEYLARCLDLSAVRQQLATAIRPHLGEAQTVGLPAILGFHQSRQTVSELESLLGVSVFEIPTPPISVPGLRIKETFEKQLRRRGTQLLWNQRVLATKPEGDPHADPTFLLRVGVRVPEFLIRARSVVLATGRFFGRGLAADRHRIRETLFDLPVHQPPDRTQWHRPDFFDPEGHPIDQAGLTVDNRLRPLDGSGRPVYATLHAAGSILAHQDWTRMKCGSGLAIATAYGAVTALAKQTKGSVDAAFSRQ